MLTSRTFGSIFGVVIKNKPYLQDGQDRRDLPTYSIPEAATYLGISPRTASYWFKESNNILVPSGSAGPTALLSFNDLTEAYVLALLTKYYEFRLLQLKEIVHNAKAETGLKRPLIWADLKVVLGRLVLDKPARGRRRRQAIDLADKNLVFPEFVDQLGIRIVRDGKYAPMRIFPWRLAGPGDDSRPVTMDPDVHSGRLIITGTRIPVTVLWDKHDKGRTVEDLADAYKISVEVVKKALDHIARPIRSKAA